MLSFSTQLPGWKVVGEHHIEKSFLFPDFRKALDFVNLVGEVAEEQGHHPDLTLTWGEVGIKIYTHKVQGLTESDFILGAKVDRLYFHRAMRSDSEPQSPIYSEAGDTER